MKKTIPIAIVAIALIVVFGFPRWKQAHRATQFDKYFEKEYGALGKTADEILSRENPTNGSTVLGALHWRIGQKADSKGEPSLSDTERRMLAVLGVEAEVNNGGFDQYFFNSTGDNAEVALVGLKEMGATATAELLERAMAVFPGSKPPADRFKRQELMQRIAAQSEPVWEKCDNEFYKPKESLSDLSLAYARKKRSEIVLP
jgi:Domain of unknown function (DUF4375)